MLEKFHRYRCKMQIQKKMKKQINRFVCLFHDGNCSKVDNCHPKPNAWLALCLRVTGDRFGIVIHRLQRQIRVVAIVPFDVVGVGAIQG